MSAKDCCTARAGGLKRRAPAVRFAVAAMVLFPMASLAHAQHASDFDPIGEYSLHAVQQGSRTTGILTIAPGESGLGARLVVQGQADLSFGTVEIADRTVTLAGRLQEAAIRMVIVFETDTTFTGTWSFGPEEGPLSGSRGLDPELVPPACPDGPGDLPAPAPARDPTPDPDAARIVTSDVTLFWEILDDADAEMLVERLHCEYLREGTDAVRDFIPNRIRSARELAEMVAERRERYEAARASSVSVAETEPAIRAVFHAMKALYPEAVFPDVYFVIGRLNTGGTVSQRGLLIGAEMYTDHSGIAAIVAHELIHYQQAPIPPDQRSLLAQSIMEGSADFVAELISGRHINERAHEYGMAREAELWAEFAEALHGTDFTGWLYGNPPEGRPADLGYFFGYRIAQAYYDRAVAAAPGDADAERRTIGEILGITDYAGFLERSGYDPGAR
jgi:hypothetical protein